jgi:hypothetical protein
VHARDPPAPGHVQNVALAQELLGPHLAQVISRLVGLHLLAQSRYVLTYHRLDTFCRASLSNCIS